MNWSSSNKKTDILYFFDEYAGRSPHDASNCTNCNSNCKAANFSEGYNGQYIVKLCSAENSTLSRDNECGNCGGVCAAFDPQRPLESPGK